MAKARKIKGLDCSADALECAGKVLRTRFEEIADFRGAALTAGNVKGVHDMRVATRRSRSALRDFKPLLEKKLFKSFKKDLKQTADALGKVRDQDVAIIALEKLRAQAKNEEVTSGIENLIDKRRAMREKAHLDLMEFLTVGKINKLREQLDEAINQHDSPAQTDFAEAGRDCIAAGLREFCDLSEHIYQPYNNDDLHKFRISAKRLRYAIELFAPCWKEDILPLAKEISGMQDFLGEVHDCDVWIEDLSQSLLEKKTAPDEHQAAVWLLSRFVKMRAQNYRSALQLWTRWQDDFIERLRNSV